MKKYVKIILLAILLIAIILISPKILHLFQPETSSGSYADFEAFIPYTMGYFPEDFTILTTGTYATHEPNLDQFEEWYGSDKYFVKIIQSLGLDVDLWDQFFAATRSLLVLGYPAEIVYVESPADWVGNQFDLNNYDTHQTRLVTFFVDELKVELVSNLPEEEFIQVIENLVPSICLNPTKEPS
ncbi:MAG: hypothetical protein HOF10_05870 [Chloroflexi bacterium]|nr:hypothetical protein [Chloroflexota bacterium]